MNKIACQFHVAVKTWVISSLKGVTPPFSGFIHQLTPWKVFQVVIKDTRAALLKIINQERQGGPADRCRKAWKPGDGGNHHLSWKDFSILWPFMTPRGWFQTKMGPWGPKILCPCIFRWSRIIHDGGSCLENKHGWLGKLKCSEVKSETDEFHCHRLITREYIYIYTHRCKS